MKTIPAVTTDELIARYDALLLDAYGVLVNKEGALPGAKELISKLNRLGKPFAKLDGGETVPLILPNPDLIYPKSSGFGITSGMVALMIETALRQRFPEREGLAFVRLGKPEPGLFVEAVRRLATRNVVMIGDQMDTDIRGAAGAGLDSALVAGGVSGAALAGGIMPTYRLESLF